MLRGIRGATTVRQDDAVEIAECVQELLAVLQAENGFSTEDIGAVIFSSTPDLTAAFPAAGARRMGQEWATVPLFGTVEIDQPGAPERCVRVLILWNTTTPQQAVKHAYLRGAAVLRPDIAKKV